jgi:hypothetical protein
MYVFHDDGMEYGWMTKLRGWKHEERERERERERPWSWTLEL